MSFCRNEREHEREGVDDFRRNGRYGYDQEQYNSRFEDDCAAAYWRGFDRERRRDDERREEEAEMERQERAAADARAEQRALEEAEWEQYEHFQEEFPE